MSQVSDEHRNLLFMRHAKSAYPTGPLGPVADHDRPLAARGVREAALAGDWLRANLPPVDSVLCSTATRARQTLTRTGIGAPVRYVDRLYGATPAVVINEICTVADDVNTLLVIGHEPTISAVALALAGNYGADTVALQRISTKFPTSGIAVLRITGSWANVEPDCGTLVGFHVLR